MNWNKLTEEGQIDAIKQLSEETPVLIYKHSTRCSLSSMSLNRLQRNWKDEDNQQVAPYFLDLIANRQLSDQVSIDFGIPHESPQVILVKNGKAVYDNSHYGISYSEIMEHLK
ncbi:bacillithiol system redox-active protein YtxJ [Algoriphagus machipongonensis]|uniref:General stress protein n=1 Tax=Algoriphagus machipongonensis TaxID=388413 RepID=A3HVK2_9BACT|nr:bacillithiol system redox-active protein YtxJ [Algoriphagus machipongonensis]EAZ82174.1 general stress protein [Algoriphagus machipongonensis]